MKFSDCVVRISTEKGQNMREYLKPSEQIVEGCLKCGFPRFSGPMSKAEWKGIQESIKNTPVLPHLPKDQFLSSTSFEMKETPKCMFIDGFLPGGKQF